MMTRSLHKGFTLVETLIAVAVLVTSVTGAFIAAQNGLSTAIYAKQEITAFYLAQEAVEQIRNIRDQNSINGDNWLKGIAETSADPCGGGKKCQVNVLDSGENYVTQCPGGECDMLRQDPINGYYGYMPSWNVTPFKREITVTPVLGATNPEVTISVTISWSKGIISQSFTARENLLDWQ